MHCGISSHPKFTESNSGDTSMSANFTVHFRTTVNRTALLGAELLLFLLPSGRVSPCGYLSCRGCGILRHMPHGQKWHSCKMRSERRKCLRPAALCCVTPRARAAIQSSVNCKHAYQEGLLEGFCLFAVAEVMQLLQCNQK